MENDENYQLIHGLGALEFITRDDEDFMLKALDKGFCPLRDFWDEKRVIAYFVKFSKKYVIAFLL